MNKKENEPFNTRLMNEAFLIFVKEDIAMKENRIKNTDTKYQYTAQLMNKALLLLLETKDLDYITVSEITKKAGVNRSTFYLHYENVYELFEEVIENLNKEFIASFDLKSIKLDSQQTAFLITDEHLVPYLNFVQKNKRVLKLIHQKPQLFRVEKTYQKMQEDVFMPAIEQFVSGDKKAPYRLEYYTKGVAAIIAKWLQQDCNLEINELIEIIKDCIGYNTTKK